MKTVTVRDFRDHASEMFHSEDVILITRAGRPAGFFLPWHSSEFPEDVARELFLRLTEQIGAQREALGISEDEILREFDAARRSR